MIPAEREAFILEVLKKNGVVTVEELAEHLNVTPMTIRRDLTRLEKQGIAYRSHGGAVLNRPLEKEQSYEVKMLRHHEEKYRIAQAAAELVKDGDTVLLDAGTTTFELATMLKTKKDLTVVTTDLKIAMELYQSDLRLFFSGGQIQKETAGAIGSLPGEFISRIHVDLAFIGTSAVSKDWHICTPTMEKVTLKQKMIDSAANTVLLTDSSKFGRNSFFKICSLTEIETLITDKHFTEQEYLELEKLKVEVIVV